MHQFVLIEKHLSSGFFWPNLLKDKRIAELSVEEIVNTYQGFEGDVVSYFLIKENEDKVRVNEYTNQCLELKKLSNCLLLHVISGSEAMPHFLKEQVIQLGYDVGALDEEGTIFSSIFNEILFGKIEELVVFKEMLNENLLFSNRSVAEAYVAVHNEMSAQGRCVEDYFEMTIYEIWKHKS